ncbi:MAG: hypothetical protein ACYTF3_02300 [Planctomycetota bacterium]|jgi:hypothetical protein
MNARNLIAAALATLCLAACAEGGDPRYSTSEPRTVDGEQVALEATVHSETPPSVTSARLREGLIIPREDVEGDLDALIGPSALIGLQIRLHDQSDPREVYILDPDDARSLLQEAVGDHIPSIGDEPEPRQKPNAEPDAHDTNDTRRLQGVRALADTCAGADINGLSGRSAELYNLLCDAADAVLR